MRVQLVVVYSSVLQPVRGRKENVVKLYPIIAIFSYRICSTT